MDVTTAVTTSLKVCQDMLYSIAQTCHDNGCGLYYFAVSVRQVAWAHARKPCAFPVSKVTGPLYVKFR